VVSIQRVPFLILAVATNLENEIISRIKMAVFWDGAPCSLVGTGVYCLIHQGDE
jgi:hypothetical protein